MAEKIIQGWMQADEVQRLMRLLPGARFVGGCVRDAILGLPIHDIDVATPDRPEEVTRLLQAEGVKVVPTGIDHGTVTAVVNRRPFEITTLRKDMACDGRHAEVLYTDDWEEDAARRDFTMNAMSLSLDGTLYDYYGGRADAEAGVLRFVGEPHARIREDYLRILRLFRFHAFYGRVPIEAEILRACNEAASEIATLSAERIQQEMMKLLRAGDPRYALQAMAHAGVLEKVIPDAELGHVAALVALEQHYGLLFHGDAPALRRLVLIADDAVSVGKAWKLSNAQQRYIAELVQAGVQVEAEVSQIKRKMRKHGKPVYADRLLIEAARADVGRDAIAEAVEVLLVWDIPELPVTGEDIMALGVKEGKEVGEMLKRAETLWEASDYTMGKEALLKKLR